MKIGNRTIGYLLAGKTNCRFQSFHTMYVDQKKNMNLHCAYPLTLALSLTTCASFSVAGILITGQSFNHGQQSFNHSLHFTTTLISITCQSPFIYRPHTSHSGRYYSLLTFIKTACVTEPFMAHYHALYLAFLCGYGFYGALRPFAPCLHSHCGNSWRL